MKRLGSTLIALALGAMLTPAPSAATTDVPAAAAWREAAATGAALPVTIEGHRLRLRLAPNDELLAPGAVVDGMTPDTLILRGTIEPAGWARIVVAGDTVVGHLGVPGLGFVPVAPLADGTIGAASAVTVREALLGSGLRTIIEPGAAETAETCSSIDWVPRFASPTTLIEADPMRTFDVAWVVDSSFTTGRSNWNALILGFINATDQIFQDAFDVRLSVVHLRAVSDATIPGTTTSALLASLQDHYVASFPGLARDNVHLFTGRDTTNAAGQANCVGSAGRTTLSYTVSQALPGGPFTFLPPFVLLPDGAVKIAAHELGHALSAHHHYANCAESGPGFNAILLLDACTVMINDWGLIQPVFSAVSRLAVRGWVDFYDI